MFQAVLVFRLCVSDLLVFRICVSGCMDLCLGLGFCVGHGFLCVVSAFSCGFWRLAVADFVDVGLFCGVL